MWLSDFRVVLPDRVLDRGAVRIADGRIAQIAETPQPGGVAGDGLTLMPGFVDMHGDMIEQEVEPRPRVDFPLEIAVRQLDSWLASTGVTTAYASVSFTAGASQGERRSYEHTSEVIRGLHAHRDGLRIDHRIHARFDITLPDALDIVGGLIGDGIVDLVSLMDHTPGQGQYRNIEKHAQQVAHMNDISVEEARARIARRREEKQVPEAVLHATLHRIATLCGEAGVPMASHDDDTVEKVALMAELGVAISEFPVTAEAAAEARARGLAVAMGAPNALRGGSYSGNLSARDAHAAGHLDMLAADYHPGAILPAALILADTDPHGLPGAVRLAATGPARALGLADRGAIEPGLRADLAIVDTTGMGHVRATLAAGRLAYSDGTVTIPA